METSQVKEINFEFKRAFLAYSMAKKYDLAGLQQLAMSKIEHHSTEMNIFDVFEALNEDFSKLQGNIDWFQDYLNEKIKVAFEEDHTTFAKNDLFGRISNVALNKFLAQRVIELYSSKVSHMLSTEKEFIQAFSNDYVPTARDSPVEKVSAEVSVAIEEAPIEDCPIHQGLTQGWSVQECSIGDLPVEEAPVQEAFIEETLTIEPKIEVSFGDASRSKTPGLDFAGLDSWGPETSWDFDMRPNGVKAKHEGRDNSPWGSSDNKNSSLNFISVAVNAGSIERAPVTEETPPRDDGYGFLGSKVKKKKKKDVAVTNNEPIPESAPDHEKPEEKDLWSFSFGNATNMKNEKNSAALIGDTFLRPEPASEPVLEPTPEATKKKGKKRAIGKNAAVIEDTSPKPELDSEPLIEPEPEAAKEDGVWGEGSGKKKKGKKGAIKVVEEEPKIEELAPPLFKFTPFPSELLPSADDGWGFGMKKNKKKDAIKIVEEESKIEELTPLPLEPASLVNDDWGFGMKKNKKKSAIKVIEEESKIEEPTPLPLEPAQLVDDGWGFGMKKNKKKDAVKVIEEEPQIEELTPLPLEPAPSADDDWGFGLKKKNKKNAKKVVEEEPKIEELRSPPLEPASLADQDWSFDMKQKKGIKNASQIVEEEPKIEELAPSPLKPAPLVDDVWDSFMVHDKKNKGKNSAKQDTLDTEPPPSHSEPELRTEPEPEPKPEEKKDKLWNDWGSTATKKKKGSRGKKELKVIAAPADGELDELECGLQNLEVICGSDISTTSPYAEQAEDVTLGALKQTEEVETSVNNGHSDLKATSEQPVKVEDGICPVRAKHLLEGDMWKTCRQCRAVLRQVAIQLASTGHADEDGYEMVDRV